jgi:hypothetical protein
LDSQTICDGMGLGDQDYPARVAQLRFLTKVRDGKLYDHIPYSFSEERTGNGEYIPLSKRRPSVRTGICRVVVEDSVSLLFGEGRFPMVEAPAPALRAVIKELITETRLGEVMNAAAVHGSVGSVAILMRILSSRAFFEMLETTYLTPSWSLTAPDTLEKVVELRKVKAGQLRAAGYIVADGEYWFQREWDAEAESWFFPISTIDYANGKAPKLDPARTVIHGLGFVPMVWIKNLPSQDKIDGPCTFEAAISTVIEMDYQLSQAGRGLKYASDPTLLIKEPAIADEGSIVRSAGNALVVSEKGDAKLLEINGTAAAAVVEYVRVLREVALESIHGNRTNVDKMSGAQSGRALELMNQGLLWLADRLRITYGQNGLLPLIRMLCLASDKMSITVGGKPVGRLNADGISLKWARFSPPSYAEKLQEAQAYRTLRDGGLMSQETVIGKIAADNDIEDLDQEVFRIAKDQAAIDARLKRQQAKVAATETDL